MENDKQVNGNEYQSAHDLEQTKRFFLSDELLAKTQKPEIYSLNDEYAKSKRNRNMLVYALILIYIAGIGIGVFFMTRLEENKIKRIEVNIAEFRQFNLMELLMEQKENQEKLAKLQRELEDLRVNSRKEIEKLSPRAQQKALAALNEKIQRLEEAYRQEIKAREVANIEFEKSIAAEKERMGLKNQPAEAIEKNINLAVQMQLRDVEVGKVRAEYEAKIEKLKSDHQKEIDDLKKENQALIDNLKKDNQAVVDNLTLRYNPVFSQGEIVSVINSRLGNSGGSGPFLNKYQRVLADENLYTEQDFNSLRAKIHNQRVIIDSLLDIPYTNSVPSALNRLDRLSRSILSDYESLWTNLAQRVKDKSDSISSYEYALNYLSTIRRECGYVIDARDQNRLLIFIDHIYSARKGDTAYIFKNEDTAVAKIELNPERGRITAKVTAILKPGERIEPFDKILLKLEVNQ